MGLHSVWCNGRGPHLELRQEPQGSAPDFLEAGSDSDLRVPVEFAQECQVSCSAEEWNSACLSSCSRGDRLLVELYLESAVFSGGSTGVSVTLRIVTSFTGLHSKRCPGIGFLSRADREIGVFGNVAPPMTLRLEFLHETGLILRCDGKVGIPFQTKQGN